MTTNKRSWNTILSAFLICIATAFLFSILLPENSVSVSAAHKKTTLKVKSRTLYVNGNYTIPLSRKKKKATYFYNSHKTKVAKVNSKGKITARNKGTAKLKVRYKYKKRIYTAGTFKVYVRKPTMKSGYRSISATVGNTWYPIQYINDVNGAASYAISSTNPRVATGQTNGKITALRAGSATLTIYEVYNAKKRSLGKISITVTGASLKSSSVKMAYKTSIDARGFLENTIASAGYRFTSANKSLLKVSGFQLTAGTSPGYNTTCSVVVTEIRSGKTRTVGTLTVQLTKDAFIVPEDRTVSIGLGSTLGIASVEGIHITNQDPNATYTFIPSNTGIISTDLKALRYGTTAVTIREQKAGSSTAVTLTETVNVTVTSATLKPELRSNGLNIMVDHAAYEQYPVSCRNQNVTYYYTSSDSSICQAGTAGTAKDQDYLILWPKKTGTVTITVYEIPSVSSVRRKLGTFEVKIEEDTSEIPNVETLTAADLIKSCTLFHNKKSFSSLISSEDLSCTFTDETGKGVLDYGMDFKTIISGSFSIIMTRSRYTIEKIKPTEDPAKWILSVNLNNESEGQESDILDVTVSLKTAPLDTNSVLSSIRVKVGAASKTVNRTTTFPQNPDLPQFAGGNTDFKVNFTAAQYIAAGATEFDETELKPVFLSELDNVFCTALPNTWTSSNTTASSTLSSISVPVTENNSLWTFTVTFEDGTTKDFTVTLGLE